MCSAKADRVALRSRRCRQHTNTLTNKPQRCQPDLQRSLVSGGDLSLKVSLLYLQVYPGRTLSQRLKSEWDSLTLRIDIAEPQFLANAPRK